MQQFLKKIFMNPKFLLIYLIIPGMGGCIKEPLVEPATQPVTLTSLKDIDNYHKKNQGIDFGLYFFGSDRHGSKWLNSTPNPNFDPKKPTVIYIHGWEKDTTLKEFRESFWVSDIEGYIGKTIHQSWQEKGWNTGIFYWNQFADEPEVRYAEAKIWTRFSPQKNAISQKGTKSCLSGVGTESHDG